MNQPIKKLSLALAATAVMWATSSQAQFTDTITLNFAGASAFNQLDAYLRSGTGVTIESPGFFNFSSPGSWTSTFWSPTIASASGTPFLGDVALSFEGPGADSFSVDFYEWNGDALSDSFNISTIDGFPTTSFPASVTESAPFVAPEPSILAFAGVCAIALAARKAMRLNLLERAAWLSFGSLGEIRWTILPTSGLP